MAKARKKVEVEIPQWLVAALACPECGTGLVLTTSGGTTCLRVPAHTGLICRSLLEDKVIEAHGLAVARRQTEIDRDKAVVLARKYLARKNPYRSEA